MGFIVHNMISYRKKSVKRSGPGRARGRVAGRAAFPKAPKSDLQTSRRLSATSRALSILASAIASISAFEKVRPQIEIHPTRAELHTSPELWYYRECVPVMLTLYPISSAGNGLERCKSPVEDCIGVVKR